MLVILLVIVELPHQGLVSEIPGAPPVDAGKQGKHVPGNNNYNPKKSQWTKGEKWCKRNTGSLAKRGSY